MKRYGLKGYPVKKFFDSMMFDPELRIENRDHGEKSKKRYKKLKKIEGDPGVEKC